MIALNSADEDSKEIVNEEDLKSTDEKSDEAPISE